MNRFIHQAGSPLNLDARAGQLEARLGQQSVETSLPCDINSEELLRGQPSVTIAHHGAIYRLQTTRQGKLILTK